MWLFLVKLLNFCLLYHFLYYLSINIMMGFKSIGRMVTVQPCSFISCRVVHSDNWFWPLPTTYFMLGVCPIKLNIQNALCEQAPSSILYIQFCMAELLRRLLRSFYFNKITLQIKPCYFTMKDI